MINVILPTTWKQVSSSNPLLFTIRGSWTVDGWMNSRVWPLPSLQGARRPTRVIPAAQGSSIIQSCVLHKAWKAFFPPLAWVTAERHASSDERRRVSLRRIWLTLSDSSVPGQFRHSDIKHIKCLSQHFTWHCSSALICYPPDEPDSVAASSLGSGLWWAEKKEEL